MIKKKKHIFNNNTHKVAAVCNFEKIFFFKKVPKVLTKKFI